MLEQPSLGESLRTSDDTETLDLALSLLVVLLSGEAVERILLCIVYLFIFFFGTAGPLTMMCFFFP